jgi:NHLM bacteriocin system ABC transporter peptidase/ATP-binding protein
MLQMEAVECGVASLAMVLAYHGRHVTLEELRVQCGVSRDGSKASNLVKGARKYGLIAKGFRYEEIEKLYDMHLPAIIFWDFNHFVVLEGFWRGKVHVNDPAQGPRVITLEELHSSFTGVILTFEPGPDFVPGGIKRSIVSTLARRLSGSELALTFVILCGLCLVIPGLVIPTFMRIFIDEYLVSGRHDFVLPLLLGMAITALLRMGLTYLQEHYLLRMETKLALATSTVFFNHMLRLPLRFFEHRYAGDIGTRVQINDRVAQVVSGRLATTVLDCALVVFYAALMLMYDVVLTLICITIAFLNVAALILVSRRRRYVSRRLQLEQGKLTGTAMNGLAMIESIKCSGSEPELFSRWAGYQARALRARQELAGLSELVSAVPPLVATLTTATILLLGSLKVMNGEMTVGMLVAYQALMAGFNGPLATFVGFGATLQELEADLNRLDDILELPQDVEYELEERDEHATSPETVKLAGRIELRDVTFGYSPLDKPLIEQLNLTVEPGQRVALVGRSGSGKSTVALLVAGLYQPWSGEILFDGIPRRRQTTSLIRNSLAVVAQDIFLFGGTVRDNVTMWDPSIPETSVTSACRDAVIDEVIQTRARTYHSLVEEGGGNFSGGQRQRLEIARALVGKPTMLILDEAMSSLDPTTELQIDDATRRLGCTCLIIAHRLSTIRDADEIIVLEQGRIVQRGTHDSMKGVPGPYSELIKG